MLDIEVMRLLSGTQGLKDIQKMEAKINENKTEVRHLNFLVSRLVMLSLSDFALWLEATQSPLVVLAPEF
jgi:hypothetical protein